MTENNCPTCRASLPGGITQLVSIQTVQYTVVPRILCGPASIPVGNCRESHGYGATQYKENLSTHPPTTFDSDFQVAQIPSGQLSTRPHGVASLARPFQAMDTSSFTGRGTNTSRIQGGCVHALSASGRKDHEADAPRQKKRSHEAGAEYLLSGREKKGGVHNERNEVSGKKSPLCVQSNCLLDGETNVRYRPKSNDGQNRLDDWDRAMDGWLVTETG